jgi:pheromone shutdown protein TraB
LKCLNCQKDAALVDSAFCPFCGKSLEKRTKLPAVSGIIAVISSALTFASGNILLISFWMQWTINNNMMAAVGRSALTLSWYSLVVGVFEIVLFGVGLFAGIAIMNKKFYKPSLLGLSLLLVCGIILTLPFENVNGWQAGLPIALLSLASIFLLVKSKADFH